MRTAVIFDFDGTVCDTEEPVFRAWAEIYAHHGCELTVEEWSAELGTHGGFAPYATLLARCPPGALASEDEVISAMRARKRALNDAAPVRPGVVEWLDRAEALGIPVGLASSSPLVWVETNLERLGLAGRFATAVCFGPDVPPKPDPTSFRQACERLGAAPGHSLAVEDSPHGVTAARTAGLFTVAVPHGLSPHERLREAGAEVVVESLADVALDDVLETIRAHRAHS